MRDTFGLFLMLVLTASAAAQTRDSNLAKPNLLLEQVVAGMLKSDKQDLRVLDNHVQPRRQDRVPQPPLSRNGLRP